MATFFAGLSSFPRSVIYITAQGTGAVVGAYWLRLVLGKAGYFPRDIASGCTVDHTLVSRGCFFVLEFMFAQALSSMALGVRFDYRNGNNYWPGMAPISVEPTLTLGPMASVFAGEGYTGPSFKSARCLGLLAAKDDLEWHYVHWLATLSAAMIHRVFYYTVTPYMRDKGLVGKPRHIWNITKSTENIP